LKTVCHTLLQLFSGQVTACGSGIWDRSAPAIVVVPLLALSMRRL
jgi:hypothetical protein